MVRQAREHFWQPLSRSKPLLRGHKRTSDHPHLCGRQNSLLHRQLPHPLFRLRVAARTGYYRLFSSPHALQPHKDEIC